jgi:YD repeat-containing protein
LKHLARHAPLLVLLVIFSAHASAQGFRVESKSPPAAAGPETFLSLEGRFSIALPKQITGYSPQTVNTPNGRVESFSYEWKTAEGSFAVGYTQRPEMLEDFGQKVLDEIRDRVVASNKAKLLSTTVITLGGHPGRELKMDFPGSVVVNRMYVVGNRLYQVIASIGTDKKDQEPNAIKILDSFKLLSQADVDAETKRQIAEATPSPLPQTPAAKKLKSDAEDEGLRGRVKIVFEEEQDLTGTWTVQKRKPSSTEYFNEQGNLTQKESYDYMGNLFEITVYGYIDGERVSNHKTVEHEYDPPPMMIASAPGGAKAESKFDPRYATRYGYRYDAAGRLAEELLYGSNGKLWTRYVYNYKGNQKEALSYDEEGTINPKHSLTAKRIATLDAQGNEVEESFFDVSKNSVDEKYSYAHEFDRQGNWVKRTASKWVKKDGKEYSEPYAVTYRTITYY